MSSDDSGEVSLDVFIKVIAFYGITIKELEDKKDFYKIEGHGKLEVKRLPPVLHRNLIHSFSHKFNIQVHYFYHPEQLAQTTDTK